MILVSVLPALWSLGPGRPATMELGDVSNIWVRWAGTSVALLTLLSVALRAATSVGSECDKGSWDALLTTRLSNNEILYGKWLGAILSTRWAMVWLAFIWGVGILSGGLHLVSAIILFVAWCVYAGLLSFMGMWFSMTCKTSFRASMWTLGMSLLLFGIPWLMWISGGNLLPSEAFWIYVGGWTFKFEITGLCPAIVFGWMAYGARSFQADSMMSSVRDIDSLEHGLILWMLATAILIWRTSERFRRMLFRGRDNQAALCQPSKTFVPWNPA